MKMTHVWTVFALVLVLLTLVAPASARHMSPVDVVLSRMRARDALEVDFREEKRIRLLRRPAISTGHILYHRDSRSLRRDTHEPTPSSVLLVGTRITMRNGTRVETLDATRPVVRALSSSFVDLLAGDRRALTQNFALEATFRDGVFTLTLTATEASLARILTNIEVRGRENVLESLVVRETSGDSSTTTFSNARAPSWQPADLERIFRL